MEQAQALMPEMDVYLYDESKELPSCTPEDFQVQLEDLPLNVESLAPSEQGIFYFFMLDVSASIPQAHFEAAKKSIRNAYAAMRPQDQLSVITFGNEVSLLLSGSESRQQVYDALDALSCQDAHTKFYDAMDMLIETAGATENMRRVAVVISDGIDDTDAGMTQSELEQLLGRSGIAVYALAIDSAGEQTTQTFRSFIRLSGGELYSFGPANAESVAADLLGRIGTVWHLKLTADTNIADGQAHTLSIRLKDAAPVLTEVTTEHWVPDHKAPQVASLQADDAGAMTVQFSKPMLGLEDGAHFLLKNPSGQDFPVTVEQVASADTVKLLAAGLSKRDGWTLTLSGLTDASMEKNPLPVITLSLADGSETAAPGAAPQPQTAADTGDADAGMTSVVLLGALLLGAVVCGICLLLLLRRRGAGKGPSTPVKKRRTDDKQQTVRFLFHEDSHEK
ncbi:VWA domain-containing protein [Oscillibacter sp.]|uniref:vWA domain-containing protein n=1 Tax=Oscillibacter sp. TaxID=1945593 RepID=UPI002616AFCE|nr:vWA domain-containing protein [Oscillibacter sp.]